MRIALTPSFIIKATADSGAERTIFWDAKLSGFGLMVTSNGARSFVVQYRANGRSRRMTLKKLSLDQARKEAKGLLGIVARDGDPLTERRKKKAAEQAASKSTLAGIAAEYRKREGNQRSIDQRYAVLQRLVLPALGARQMPSIARSDINRLLDRIEDERGEAMAAVTLKIWNRLNNWYAARDDHYANPIVRGMRRSTAKARSRILSDDELRRVWTTASERPGPFPALIRFLLLTAARRNEAARMTWDEIDGGDWLLPASRNKTKQDFVRPLSKVAQAVLAGLPRIANCEFIFTNDGHRPIAGFSKAKRIFDQACGVTGWTLHDLRRSARSLMSRAGINADIAERCLGHALVGVRATYDRHSYREEMLRTFKALAAQIERIVYPKENVVAMARK